MAVERDRPRFLQSGAIAKAVALYQQVLAGELSEKIGEERGDTRNVVLAIVGGEDLSRRLFGSMS